MIPRESRGQFHIFAFIPCAYIPDTTPSHASLYDDFRRAVYTGNSAREIVQRDATLFIAFEIHRMSDSSRTEDVRHPVYFETIYSNDSNSRLVCCCTMHVLHVTIEDANLTQPRHVAHICMTHGMHDESSDCFFFFVDTWTVAHLFRPKFRPSPAESSPRRYLEQTPVLSLYINPCIRLYIQLFCLYNCKLLLFLLISLCKATAVGRMKNRVYAAAVRMLIYRRRRGKSSYVYTFQRIRDATVCRIRFFVRFLRLL